MADEHSSAGKTQTSEEIPDLTEPIIKAEQEKASEKEKEEEQKEGKDTPPKREPSEAGKPATEDPSHGATGATNITGIYSSPHIVTEPLDQPEEKVEDQTRLDTPPSKVEQEGKEYYLNDDETQYKSKKETDETKREQIDRDPENVQNKESAGDRARKLGNAIAEMIVNSNLDTNIANALGTLRAQLRSIGDGNLVDAAGLAVDASLMSLRIIGDGVGSFKDTVKRTYNISAEDSLARDLGNWKEAVVTMSLDSTKAALNEGLGKMIDAANWSYGLKPIDMAKTPQVLAKLIPKENRAEVKGILAQMTPEERNRIVNMIYKGDYDVTSDLANAGALAKYGILKEAQNQPESERERFIQEKSADYSLMGTFSNNAVRELSQFPSYPAQDGTQNYYNAIVRLRDEAEAYLQALNNGWEYEYDDEGNIMRDSSGHAITHNIDKSTARRRRAVKAQLDLYNQAIEGMDSVLGAEKGKWTKTGSLLTPSKRELARREKAERLAQYQKEPVDGAVRVLTGGNPDKSIETLDLGDGICIPKNTRDGYGRSHQERLETAMERMEEDFPGYTEKDFASNPGWVSNHNALACIDIHSCAQMKRDAVKNSPDYATYYEEIDNWEKQECDKYRWRGDGITYQPYKRESLKEWMATRGLDDPHDYADTLTVSKLFPGVKGIEDGAVGIDEHGDPIFNCRKKDSNMMENTASKNRMGGLFARYVELSNKYQSGKEMTSAEKAELTRLEKIKRRQELRMAVEMAAARIVNGQLKNSDGDNLSQEMKERIKQQIIRGLYAYCAEDLRKTCDWTAVDTSEGSNIDNPKLDCGRVDGLLTKLSNLNKIDGGDLYKDLVSKGYIDEVDLDADVEKGLVFRKDFIAFNDRLPSNLERYPLEVDNQTAEQREILKRIFEDSDAGRAKLERMNQFLKTGLFKHAYANYLSNTDSQTAAMQFLQMATEDIHDLGALGYLTPKVTGANCRDQINEIVQQYAGNRLWDLANRCDLVFPKENPEDPDVSVKDVFSALVIDKVKDIREVQGKKKAYQLVLNQAYYNKAANKAITAYLDRMIIPQGKESKKTETSAKTAGKSGAGKSGGSTTETSRTSPIASYAESKAPKLDCYADPQLMEVLTDASLPRKNNTEKTNFMFCPKTSTADYLGRLDNLRISLAKDYANATDPEEKKAIKAKWAKLMAYKEVYAVNFNRRPAEGWALDLGKANRYYNDLVAGFNGVQDLNVPPVEQIVKEACNKQGVMYNKTSYDWINESDIVDIKTKLCPRPAVEEGKIPDMTEFSDQVITAGAEGKVGELIKELTAETEDSKKTRPNIKIEGSVQKTLNDAISKEDQVATLVGNCARNLITKAWADCVTESPEFRTAYNNALTSKKVNKKTPQYWPVDMSNEDLKKEILQFAGTTDGQEAFKGLTTANAVFERFCTYLEQSEDQMDETIYNAGYVEDLKTLKEALKTDQCLNSACWDACRMFLDEKYPEENKVARFNVLVHDRGGVCGGQPILFRRNPQDKSDKIGRIQNIEGTNSFKVVDETGFKSALDIYRETPSSRFASESAEVPPANAGEQPAAQPPAEGQPVSEAEGAGEAAGQPAQSVKADPEWPTDCKDVEIFNEGFAPMFGSRTGALKDAWVAYKKAVNAGDEDGTAAAREKLYEISPLFMAVSELQMFKEDGKPINGGLPTPPKVKDFLYKNGITKIINTEFNKKLAGSKESLKSLLQNAANFNVDNNRSSQTASQLADAGTKVYTGIANKIKGKGYEEDVLDEDKNPTGEKKLVDFCEYWGIPDKVKDNLIEEMFWVGLNSEKLHCTESNGRVMCAAMRKVPEGPLFKGFIFDGANSGDPASYKIARDQNPYAGYFWGMAKPKQEGEEDVQEKPQATPEARKPSAWGYGSPEGETAVVRAIKNEVLAPWVKDWLASLPPDKLEKVLLDVARDQRVPSMKGFSVGPGEEGLEQRLTDWFKTNADNEAYKTALMTLDKVLGITKDSEDRLGSRVKTIMEDIWSPTRWYVNPQLSTYVRDMLADMVGSKTDDAKSIYYDRDAGKYVLKPPKKEVAKEKNTKKKTTSKIRSKKKGEEASAKKPAAKKKPAEASKEGETPAKEQTAKKKPAAKKPTEKKPAAKKPAAKKPAEEKTPAKKKRVKPGQEGWTGIIDTDD